MILSNGRGIHELHGIVKTSDGLNGGFRGVEDMLVGERKSRAEESNLIKYMIIISHREAHEPPDTSRGSRGCQMVFGRWPDRVSHLFPDFEGEADRRSYHPEGSQLT
jgi:hypothetical protein